MLDYIMKPYDEALQEILEQGTVKYNKRTGEKTLAIFGIQKRYRIDKQFPIITRRKVWPKSIFAELLWFVSGSTNNKDLQSLGSNIWTPWVDPEFEKRHGFAEGSLGPVYGFQLRYFNGIYGNGIGGPSNTNEKGSMYGKGGFDQLQYMMDRIKQDPSCRRILFSLWNPDQLHMMRLPPCHYTFQIFIDNENRMSGMLTQRSCDFPIGVPANIQFYSALTYMIAQQTGYQPYEFIHSTGDSHIYENQIEAVKQYLSTPINFSPKLILTKAKDIFSYTMDDFLVHKFETGPKIEIPVAI